MKRSGNFHWTIPLGGPAYLVHRGVSQASRQLEAGARERFWLSNSSKLFPEPFGGGRFTTEMLQIMREKSLVVVTSPERPRVWTPKRIVRFGKKIKIF